MQAPDNPVPHRQHHQLREEYDLDQGFSVARSRCSPRASSPVAVADGTVDEIPAAAAIADSPLAARWTYIDWCRCVRASAPSREYPRRTGRWEDSVDARKSLPTDSSGSWVDGDLGVDCPPSQPVGVDPLPRNEDRHPRSSYPRTRSARDSDHRVIWAASEALPATDFVWEAPDSDQSLANLVGDCAPILPLQGHMIYEHVSKNASSVQDHHSTHAGRL